MYINYGSSGFNIQTNALASTMFMSSASLVGINTITLAWTLDVAGTIRATKYIYPNTIWNGSNEGSSRTYYVSGGRSYYASGDGSHEFRTDVAASVGGMILDASTNLTCLGNGLYGAAKVDDCGFGSTFAAFAHIIAFTSFNCALLPDSGGTTYLNCATGGTMFFRIGNGNVGNWTSTGFRIGDGAAATATLNVKGTTLLDGNYVIKSTDTLQAYPARLLAPNLGAAQFVDMLIGNVVSTSTSAYFGFNRGSRTPSYARMGIYGQTPGIHISIDGTTTVNATDNTKSVNLSVGGSIKIPVGTIGVDVTPPALGAIVCHNRDDRTTQRSDAHSHWQHGHNFVPSGELCRRISRSSTSQNRADHV